MNSTASRSGRRVNSIVAGPSHIVWTIAALASAAISLTGCGAVSAADPGGGADPGTRTPIVAVPTTTAPTPAETWSAPPIDCAAGTLDGGQGACVPCPDYEGCFDEPADMEYFYDQIIYMITDYSDDTYADMSGPDHWYYVAPGDAGDEACVDEAGNPAQYSAFSYEFCPADVSVYVGEQSMWDFYRDLGDAAVAVSIAHEWGHYVQMIGGVTATTRDQVINMENQADCVAGAWSWYMVEQGVLVEDDFGDIGGLLVSIQSLESPTRTHGTLVERQNSFMYGFQHGMTGCNDYVPQDPLIT